MISEKNEVPLVSALQLHDDGGIALIGTECVDCGAVYFSSRLACASCGGRSFSQRRVGDRGAVLTYTIVHRAAPGVTVPFVSAVVDLDGGGRLKGNLVGIPPEPHAVARVQRVRLTRLDCGVDAEGTRAVGFAFLPEEVDGVV